jgi:hypothetical protein
MAAHTISMNRKEYNEDGSYAEAAGAGAAQPKRLLYSYFTAGALLRGTLGSRPEATIACNCCPRKVMAPGAPPGCGAHSGWPCLLPGSRSRGDCSHAVQAPAAQGPRLWKPRCCWRGRRWWHTSEEAAAPCTHWDCKRPLGLRALADCRGTSRPACFTGYAAFYGMGRHLVLCCVGRAASQHAVCQGRPISASPAPGLQGRAAHRAAPGEQPARGGLWGGGGPPLRLPVQPAGGVFGIPGKLVCAPCAVLNHASCARKSFCVCCISSAVAAAALHGLSSPLRPLPGVARLGHPESLAASLDATLRVLCRCWACPA